MNKVILIGNVGSDPTVTTTQSGKTLTKLSVACTESYRDNNGEWKKVTEWVNVEIWRGINPSIAKGSIVSIEGKIATSSYTDKNNNKVYKTFVAAENIILLSGKSSSTPSTQVNSTNDQYYNEHFDSAELAF